MDENTATVEVIEATVATAPKLVPTRTKINPANPAEDAPLYDEGSVAIVVVENERGVYRAILSGPLAPVYAIGDEIESKRFGHLVMVGLRDFGGATYGLVPDENLPVRVFAA
jgi:hypothetical protein